MAEKNTPFAPVPIEYDGKNYLVMVPFVSKNGKKYHAAELASKPEVLADLMAHAWKGRDEYSFNYNGIFKLVYTEASFNPGSELEGCNEPKVFPDGSTGTEMPEQPEGDKDKATPDIAPDGVTGTE